MQTNINGDCHPCAYMSKSFSPAEHNYEVYDRELLGIIHALREWWHYVQGSPHETIIYSDHKNLTYFCNPQKLNRWQAGWSLELSEYDLKLIHLPGSRMIQSDALSCWPDFYLDDNDDNVDVTLLPDNLFVNLIDFDLQQQIAKSDLYDSTATSAIKLQMMGLWQGYPPPSLSYISTPSLDQNARRRRYFLCQHTITTTTTPPLLETQDRGGGISVDTPPPRQCHTSMITTTTCQQQQQPSHALTTTMATTPCINENASIMMTMMTIPHVNNGSEDETPQWVTMTRVGFGVGNSQSAL